MSPAPRFLGLDCVQLEIIGMLKRHFGVANYAVIAHNFLMILIKEIIHKGYFLFKTLISQEKPFCLIFI